MIWITLLKVIEDESSDWCLHKGASRPFAARWPLVARNLVLGWVFSVFFIWCVCGVWGLFAVVCQISRPCPLLAFILLSLLLHPSLASFYSFGVSHSLWLSSPFALPPACSFTPWFFRCFSFIVVMFSLPTRSPILSSLDSFCVPHSLWFCSPPSSLVRFFALLHFFWAELVRSWVGSPPAISPTHLYYFPRAISPCQGADKVVWGGVEAQGVIRAIGGLVQTISIS